MRIEDLYTIKTNEEDLSSKKQIFFKDFVISGSTISVQDGMWTATISGDDELNEMINNGKIITQIYDELGNEVGSGGDIITKITENGITISCVSQFTYDLTLRVFGIGNANQEISDTKFQKFIITKDDVVADDDEVGWNFVINQDDLEEIILGNGSISVMIYNKNGIDVTTSPLLVVPKSSCNITIRSIADITAQEVYSIIVKQN